MSIFTIAAAALVALVVLFALGSFTYFYAQFAFGLLREAKRVKAERQAELEQAACMLREARLLRRRALRQVLRCNAELDATYQKYATYGGHWAKAFDAREAACHEYERADKRVKAAIEHYLVVCGTAC